MSKPKEMMMVVLCMLSELGLFYQFYRPIYFLETDIIEKVLWSSVFVTLMAKKYRFMQFELDMVFDTH